MYICISHKGISWDPDLAIWKLGSESRGCCPRNGNLGMETDVNRWKGTSVCQLIPEGGRGPRGRNIQQGPWFQVLSCWTRMTLQRPEMGTVAVRRNPSFHIIQITIVIFTSCARPHLCSFDSYGSSMLHEGSAVAIWFTKDPHICWSPNHES